MMNTKSQDKDVLSESMIMLRELNHEINAHLNEVPDDLKALLIQKGALTQCVFRELSFLLDQATQQTERYEEVLGHCARWREEFFLPLRAQCNDVPLEEPVNTRDLDQLLTELDSLLTASGQLKS